MNLEQLDQAAVSLHHHAPADARGSCPAYPEDLLAVADCETARGVIASWPGYRPSPLHVLKGLAHDLGIAGLYYKDESERFGLGSFKALGGAYAVLRLLAREISIRTGCPVSDTDVVTAKFPEAAGKITVITATDGNHGRSVAWGAKQFGCECFIYMHTGVSKARAAAVEDFGATVVWVDGNYDDSVRRAAADAAANGWFVVSDTSWEGYTDIPRHVMAGYTTMTEEIAGQLPAGEIPSHVFVQGGCGGLAGAVLGHLWQMHGENCPRFIVVEPDRADCLYKSACNGRPTDVRVTDETLMAGLSCGEVSLIGWEILSAGANDFMTITDDLVAPVMTLLAKGVNGDQSIVAGESAVAGLAGLIAARRNPDLSERLALDEHSRVLVFGTEGATDPVIYRYIVGSAPEDVAA